MSSQKIHPGDTCTGEVLQFLTGGQAGNIVKYSHKNRGLQQFHQNRLKLFLSHLSAACPEEAASCLQQRNHFKHNQRRELCWQEVSWLHFDLKATDLPHTVPNLKGKNTLELQVKTHQGSLELFPSVLDFFSK